MKLPSASAARCAPLARALVLAGLTACLLSALPASAAAAEPLEAQAQHWIDDLLASQSAVTRPSAERPDLRLEVSVGSLDSRLRLAPCGRVEPYLPPNTRLWGRARIGLRCTDGMSRWNVFLPVTVKAWGPAWVLRDAVPAGTVLGPEHAMATEVDWAEEPAAIVLRPDDWVGQVTTRPLSAGQALRQNQLRAPQAFAAGSQVRVLVEGPGFSVASDGQALTAGVVGQPVRVRMDNGRVLTAEVLDSRTVRLGL